MKNSEKFPSIDEATEAYRKFIDSHANECVSLPTFAMWYDYEYTEPPAPTTQQESDSTGVVINVTPWAHPHLGKRCVVRTYSAGVHIGTIAKVNPLNSMEMELEGAIRLWKWEKGGLSLSAIANNGMKGGRCNYTGSVVLTNVIETIPCTEKAWESYQLFIEDKE